MMFCFKSILQIWIVLIGFRDTILWTPVFVNMSSNSPAVAIADLLNKTNCHCKEGGVWLLSHLN